MQKLKTKWAQLNYLDKSSLVLFFSFHFVIVMTLYTNMHWFYLDMPYCITLYQRMSLTDWFFNQVERFYPMTWIIHSFVSIFLSDSPKVHFLVQYLYWFIGLTVCFALLSKFKLRCWHKIFIIMLMGICTTFAESMFTIGKQELLLSVCIIFFLKAAYTILYADSKNIYGNLMLYELSIFICLLTKETAMILLVPMGLLALYTLIYDQERRRKASLLGGILLLNFIVLYVYKNVYVVDSNYVSFRLEPVSYLRGILWYLKYHFDIMIVGGVSGIVCFTKWIKAKGNHVYAFLLSVNLSGWAYLLAISIFRQNMSYYIYPMVVLFAISFAIIFITGFQVKLCVALLAIPLLYAAEYNSKVAVSHIDLGKAFTESLESVIEHTDHNGERVLVENYNFYEEPITEANILLNYWGHPMDLLGIHQEISSDVLDTDTVELYGYTMQEYEAIRELFQPRVGDYILVYFNRRAFRGPIRGVNPSGLIGGGASVYETTGSGYKVELIDKNVCKRQWLSLKSADLLEETQAGYALYKITELTFQTEGIYADGWSREEITITGADSANALNIRTGAMACSWRGEEVNGIDIVLNGEVIETVEIKNSGSQFIINDYIESFTATDIIKLVIQKADSPINYGSDDDRMLGVQITIF